MRSERALRLFGLLVQHGTQAGPTQVRFLSFFLRTFFFSSPISLASIWSLNRLQTLHPHIARWHWQAARWHPLWANTADQGACVRACLLASCALFCVCGNALVVFVGMLARGRAVSLDARLPTTLDYDAILGAHFGVHRWSGAVLSWGSPAPRSRIRSSLPRSIRARGHVHLSVNVRRGLGTANRRRKGHIQHHVALLDPTSWWQCLIGTVILRPHCELVSLMLSEPVVGTYCGFDQIGSPRS